MCDTGTDLMGVWPVCTRREEKTTRIMLDKVRPTVANDRDERDEFSVSRPSGILFLAPRIFRSGEL